MGGHDECFHGYAHAAGCPDCDPYPACVCGDAYSLHLESMGKGEKGCVARDDGTTPGGGCACREYRVPPRGERSRGTAKIRERSGAVTSKDRLVAFLYTLMRDEVTPGTVEDIVKGANLDRPDVDTYIFSNGWLAQYAEDVAERLRG